MKSRSNNRVAKILKIYSVINVIVVIIISIFLGTEYDESYFIIGAALGIFVNFFIYAFGELIDLLAEIRDNTKNFKSVSSEESEYSDLPDL